MFVGLKPGPQIESVGILDDSGVLVADVRGTWCPLTVSLASTAAGRRIELTNDDVTWFDPVLDLVADDEIAVVLAAPVRHVRLTGQAGDRWGIS